MKKVLIYPVLVCLIALCGGCYATAAKQAALIAMGPQGDYVLIESPEPAALAKYTQIEVAPFENTLPMHISKILADAVQTETVKRLKEEGFFAQVESVNNSARASSGDALLITGRLLDVTTDKVPGQKLVTSGTHLIARVQIKDHSGKGVITANVRGLVKSFTDDEETDPARGFAKGVLELLEKTFEKEKEEEEE